jgi:hypothetical protein
VPVQPAAQRFALMSDLPAYLTTAAYAADKGVPNGVATLRPDGTIQPAQLPVGIGGFFAVKAADTSRASTTTRTDDPELFVDLPTGLYRFESLTNLTGSNANGFFAATNGGAATGIGTGPRLAGTVVSFSAAPVSSANLLTLTGAVHAISTFRMTAAGRLVLQWAQNASSATPSVLTAGSWIKLDRLAA